MNKVIYLLVFAVTMWSMPFLLHHPALVRASALLFICAVLLSAICELKQARKYSADCPTENPANPDSE